MQEFQAVTDIEADLAVGWRVMTDFAAFPQWNPLLRAVKGKPEKGASLGLRVARSLGSDETAPLPARVRVVAPEQEIAWGGGVPGVFDVHHYFRFERADKGFRFIHGEIFSGLLVPVIWPVIKGRVRLENYKALNQAFKQRCESMSREV